MTQEEIHNVFQNVHQAWPISLAGTAVIGLVLWLMGRRMIRPAMAICGIFIGAAIGFTLSHEFNTNDGLLWMWTGVGAVAGALGAWLLYRAWMAISLGLLAAVIVPATAIAFTGTPEPAPGDRAPGPSSTLTQNTAPPNTATKEDQSTAAEDDTDASVKDESPSTPKLPINSLTAEEIKEAGAEVINDITRTLTKAIRAAYEHQSERIKLWWEAMDSGQHKNLLITTLIGVGIGLLVGFLFPNITASIETALIGTVMLFIATRGILATYSDTHVAWLPNDPQHIFITVGLITVLGICLQWTFFRKAADK